MSLDKKIDFEKIIHGISNSKTEADIKDRFVDKLVSYLGYDEDQIHKEVKSEKGSTLLDYVCDKGKNLPAIFIESKFKDIILESAKYESVIENQIQTYISDNPGKFRFGIISNGKSISVYRNHFGVAVQVLGNSVVNQESIEGLFKKIKSIIVKSKEIEPVIISIFNNKGGVGKTTISYFLSRVLADVYNKKVLAMDFDPLQGDLTRLMRLPKEKYLPLIDWITLSKQNLLKRISESEKRAILTKGKNLHCVYADTDENFLEYTKHSASITKIRDYSKKIRSVLKSGIGGTLNYDFVIIDTPPGWWFYPMLANAISDLVIIPVNPTNPSSWKNAIRYVRAYLPALKNDLKNRIESGPVPLPILYNKLIDSKTKKNRSIYKYQAANEFLHKELGKPIDDKNFYKVVSKFIFRYKSGSDRDDHPDHPIIRENLQIQEIDISNENKPIPKEIIESFKDICEFYFPELKTN